MKKTKEPKGTAVQIRGANGEWLDPIVLRRGEETMIHQPFDFATTTFGVRGWVDIEIRLVEIDSGIEP